MAIATADPVELDLRGLKCPLPAIKVSRALERAPKGTRLRVLATDPMSAIDIPHAVAKAGARLLSQDRTDRRLLFEIER